MSSLHTPSLSATLPLPHSRVATNRIPYPLVVMATDNEPDSAHTFAQVVTTVLWSSCLAVGLLGFVLPYSRPHILEPAVKPVSVEKLVIQLTKESPSPVMLPTESVAIPPPPSALVQPQIVQPITVAEPSTVAFALPVAGPTVTVATEQAAHVRPAIITVQSSTGLPTPETLIFGQGEGRQPAPEYPARAVKLGQEGVVDVRLTVDPNGRVIDTIVSTPCQWALLNDAAERTVRHRWRFPTGATRVYQVAIRFALAQ